MKTVKVILKYLMAIFYVGAGVNHFINPDFYMKIMPPYLPWHSELVFLSGVIEVALGILVLIPKYTRLAAWGIILLLIAVFPANIHLALNPQIFPDVNPVVHLIRLPFQGLFLLWAWWYTRPDSREMAMST
jgi:uncharacterized membrane protein